MVVAGRRRRTARRPRWLLLALGLTLVVVIVNALATSRSDGAGRRIEELAYLDEMRPQVEQSTELGAELEEVRTTAGKLGRDGIKRRIERINQQGALLLRAVRGGDPPPSLADAHSLLVSTMLIRVQAARRMGSALQAALGTDQPDGAIAAMSRAGDDMVTADRTYVVFLRSLPVAKGRAAVSMPRSRWVDNEAEWSRGEVAALVTTIRSSATLSPVHDVGVVLVTTDPAAVGSENGASVLPATKQLKLQVVVANVGNERETKVPVMAAASALSGGVDTARDFVDLDPGQRLTVNLTLRPAQGQGSTLTVLIGPVTGEVSSDNNQHIQEILIR